MAGWRQAVELAMTDEEIRRLAAIARSRSEAARRVVRARIGAAQKSAGSKELRSSRHPIIAFVIGTLIALAIIAGMFALLAYQQ